MDMNDPSIKETLKETLLFAGDRTAKIYGAVMWFFLIFGLACAIEVVRLWLQTQS